MDILYPHQWTTINQNLTYAVLCPTIHINPEYNHYSSFDQKQPLGLKASLVITPKQKQLPELQYVLFNDIIKISFFDKAVRYKFLMGIISEDEYMDPSLIVRQI